MATDEQYPVNGTNERKYWYIYNVAKKHGDRYPEITASQFAVESGYGKSAKGKNNFFNQTAVGDTLAKRKFVDYASVDDAIKARVKKWSAKYKDAPNAVQALAIIQPSYAPNKDKNENYIKNVMTIAKQYGLYKGSTSLPNADVKPQFYQEGRGMNKNGWYSYTQTSIDKNWKEYNAEVKKLDERIKKGEPEQLIANERVDLQRKYQDMGLRGHFNAEIDKENKVIDKEKKVYDNKYKAMSGMIELLNDPSLINEDAFYKQGGLNVITPGQDMKINFSDEQQTKLKEILKENPEYAKYFKTVKSPKKGTDIVPPSQYKKGQKGVAERSQGAVTYEEKNKVYADELQLFIPRKNDGKNLFSALEKDAKFFDPETKFSIYNKEGKINNTGGLFTLTGLSADDLINAPLRTGDLKNTNFRLKNVAKGEFVSQIKLREHLTEIPETVSETTTEEKIQIDPNTATEVDIAIVKEKETKRKETEARAKTVAEAEKVIENNANNYYADEIKAPAAYQDEQFKNPFPFAEVLSGAMGVAIGANMAKKEIPKRTEQVSDAYRNYTAELAKLSQIGLRPEEEGYAKRMLTESYQSSISTLENQANGNRNIILGNLGRVDFATQQGMLEIAMADSKAKTDAMYKYGEAVKYINEFDSRRDIANNEREYQDVLLTKQAGGELMGSAFTSILENFQNYKDNGPGSVNHAYKSKFYRDAFGIDPSLKDNGKGDTPFTPSFKKMEDQKLVEQAKQFNETRQSYWSLDPEKRKIADTFLNHNRTSEASSKMIDYLKKTENPGVLNLEKSAEALKNNDYSQMFGAKEVAKIDASTNNIATQDKTVPPEIAPGPVVPTENGVKTPEVISPIQKMETVGLVMPTAVAQSPTAPSMPTNQNKGVVTNEQILNAGKSVTSTGAFISEKTTGISESKSAMDRFTNANDELEKYLKESKGNSTLDEIISKTEKDTLNMQQQMVSK